MLVLRFVGKYTALRCRIVWWCICQCSKLHGVSSQVMMSQKTTLLFTFTVIVN